MLEEVFRPFTQVKVAMTHHENTPITGTALEMWLHVKGRKVSLVSKEKYVLNRITAKYKELADWQEQSQNISASSSSNVIIYLFSVFL